MVESAYAAYHEVDSAQATLEAMKREPILLPSEEEKLIQGLRDAKFFDIFDYDDQKAEWFAVAGERSAAAATGRSGVIFGLFSGGRGPSVFEPR